MKSEAIRVIAEFVNSRIGDEPISEQIRVYQALAEILPAQGSHVATQIAIALSRVSALQLDFTQQLFRSNQPPQSTKKNRASR